MYVYGMYATCVQYTYSYYHYYQRFREPPENQSQKSRTKDKKHKTTAKKTQNDSRSSRSSSLVFRRCILGRSLRCLSFHQGCVHQCLAPNWGQNGLPSSQSDGICTAYSGSFWHDLHCDLHHITSSVKTKYSKLFTKVTWFIEWFILQSHQNSLFIHG